MKCHLISPLFDDYLAFVIALKRSKNETHDVDRDACDYAPDCIGDCQRDGWSKRDQGSQVSTSADQDVRRSHLEALQK